MVFIKTSNLPQNLKSIISLKAFLDVASIADNDTIETTVYSKPTDSDIYLNWKSLSLCSWKRDTSETIIRREYLMFPTPDYLQK